MIILLSLCPQLALKLMQNELRWIVQSGYQVSTCSRKNSLVCFKMAATVKLVSSKKNKNN